MDKNERIAEIEINIESQKNTMEFYLQQIMENNAIENSTELVKQFMQKHKEFLKQHENEDKTDISRFYRHIMMFKPALNSILKPGKEYDELCDAIVYNFNIVIDRVRKQVNDKNTKKKIKGPILPGSNKSFELRYFCSVCNEDFEIPPEIKAHVFPSGDNRPLPGLDGILIFVNFGKRGVFETFSSICINCESRSLAMATSFFWPGKLFTSC